MKPNYYLAHWKHFGIDSPPAPLRWPSLLGLIQRMRDHAKTPYSVHVIEAVYDAGVTAIVPEEYYMKKLSQTAPAQRTGYTYFGKAHSIPVWLDTDTLSIRQTCFEEGHRELLDDPNNRDWESCTYCGIERPLP